MASLRLNFMNANREPLDDVLDVQIFEAQTSKPVLIKKNVKGKAAMLVKGLAPNRAHIIRAYPMRHRPVATSMRTPAGGDDEPGTVDLFCPVHPDRVSEVIYPAFKALPKTLRDVLDASTLELDPDETPVAADAGASLGQTLWDKRLSSTRKAGLLNVFSKMSATPLGTKTTWDYVKDIYRVRGDRIFVNVTVDFRDLVKSAVSSGRFKEVDGSLHKPPDDCDAAGSFKTRNDRYGNLQLTFFCSKESPKRFRVDADIDDAAGIEHAFQVLDHWITKGQTHPYDIHQILTFHQSLAVPYSFRV